MMRCIIVEDEPLVRELLEDHVRQIPFLQLDATCKTAWEALEIIRKKQVDLILLDVRMPGLNGLQFLQSLQHAPLVIMVTAYEEYAVEGFNLEVVDYVLKPFGFDRLLKACNRALEMFELKRSASAAEGNKQQEFFVNVEYTLVKIIVSDITYIEGVKDYIKIHLASSKKPVFTRMSITSIESKLPEGCFVRTHKSFLVSVSKITIIKRGFFCVGDIEIPVSETYKGNFSGLLNQN